MEKRIYYHDTDAGGVVYYGRYLSFFEEARTEFLESKGMSIKDLHNKGFLYAVYHCDVTYKKPARYGDQIICTAILKEIKGVRLHFHQQIIDKESQDVLTDAHITLVSLTKSFKPNPISIEIREYLTS